MTLFIVTGTCGAGKTTVVDRLHDTLDPSRYYCCDTDQLGFDWRDYAGTDHEAAFNDDCLREAVRRGDGRDVILSSCMNPQDYFGRHTVPESVDSTVFILLCPSDETIENRLRARPVEWGFGSDEAIRPHIEYNRWFRRNRGKFPLWIDSGAEGEAETASRIAEFIEGFCG